jgi:hypothetical protein
VQRVHLSALFLVAALVLAVGARAGDDKLPKAPDGWKYVTGKDGSYHFLFPTATKRAGSRQQTIKRTGLTGKAQIHYCTLKDDTSLAIEATSLSGSALKGLKIGDVYNLMIDGDKEGGATVSEPKAFPVGKLKAREYFVTKGSLLQRKVLLVVRGRVYELSVAAPSKEQTTNATADTFLKSLVLVEKAPATKEVAKETTGDKLPATPPPTIKLKLPQTAAYRPTFKYADGKEDTGGTVFVVKAPSGKKVAVTAAHVLEPKEWAMLRSTKLSTMAGKKVLDLAGKPAYVGRAFDELPPLRKSPVSIYNTSEDFALWVLPDAAELTVLELADREPKVNEWVWIAGQQQGRPLLFYRSKVTDVLNGTMVMEQHDRFNPVGFSGGPVVTAEGKVIGTMLAGDPKGNMRQGATVGNLRKRLKDR